MREKKTCVQLVRLPAPRSRRKAFRKVLVVLLRYLYCQVTRLKYVGSTINESWFSIVSVFRLSGSYHGGPSWQYCPLIVFIRCSRVRYDWNLARIDWHLETTKFERRRMRGKREGGLVLMWPTWRLRDVRRNLSTEIVRFNVPRGWRQMWALRRSPTLLSWADDRTRNLRLDRPTHHQSSYQVR